MRWVSEEALIHWVWAATSRLSAHVRATQALGQGVGYMDVNEGASRALREELGTLAGLSEERLKKT